GEAGARRRLRHLVDLGEPAPVDVAETFQRAERRVVEVGDARHAGGAEDLRAPADLLHTREREEVAEGVPRPPARRGAVVVVRERSPAAERTAREDARRAAVERRQQVLDVGRRAESRGTRLLIGRDDAIAERLERRPLVSGEEAAPCARRCPARAGEGRGEGGEEDGERLQELAAAEEEGERPPGLGLPAELGRQPRR